jgi:hypothetical protein
VKRNDLIQFPGKCHISDYLKWGYFMPKSELRELKETLKNEIKGVKNALASLERDFKVAAPQIDYLSRLLKRCNVGAIDWSVYQRLIAELPKKSYRYETLKLALADKEAQLDKFIK